MSAPTKAEKLARVERLYRHFGPAVMAWAYDTPEENR